MIITLATIAAAFKAVSQHCDINGGTEEGQFYVEGSPAVLTEFELCLALELARPNYGERMNETAVRNYFVDLVELRKESGHASTDDRVWTYNVEVLGDIKAHEIRLLSDI
jgi:hypothetical protein